MKNKVKQHEQPHIRNQVPQQRPAARPRPAPERRAALREPETGFSRAELRRIIIDMIG